MDDNPLRANSPTDSGFGVLNLPETAAPIDKVTKEQKDLVKAAKSPEGKIILEHMQTQLDILVHNLKHTEYAGVDPTAVAADVMASQKAIKIFEDVLNSVKISQQAIKDAAKQS
jgi:hypothetical protein